MLCFFLYSRVWKEQLAGLLFGSEWPTDMSRFSTKFTYWEMPLCVVYRCRSPHVNMKVLVDLSFQWQASNCDISFVVFGVAVMLSGLGRHCLQYLLVMVVFIVTCGVRMNCFFVKEKETLIIRGVKIKIMIFFYKYLRTIRREDSLKWVFVPVHILQF